MAAEMIVNDIIIKRNQLFERRLCESKSTKRDRHNKTDDEEDYDIEK